MAQTGYTPISIYYSATSTNVPTAGNLVAGELAINTADGKLFYKDSAGVVQVIAGKGGAGVAGGSTTQVQYNSSGSLAGSANFIWDNTNVKLGIGKTPSAGTPQRFQIKQPDAIYSGISIEKSDDDSYLGIGYWSTSAAWTFQPTYQSTGSYLPLAFATSGLERMRITTAGNVGIGTSSPTIKLVTIGEMGTQFSTNDSILKFGNNGTVASISATYGTTGSYVPIQFLTSDTERMRINAGAPILCLAGGNTSATGTGIAFPATQSASSDANTLDDYEEGTFTPTIAGTTTAGTATYGSQNARYTKVGRLVQFEIYLAWTGGTGTGSLEVRGLPFTNSSSATYSAVCFSYVNNLALSASHILTGYVTSGSTTINLNSYAAGGSTVQSVAYDSSAEFIVSGVYST